MVVISRHLLCIPLTLALLILLLTGLAPCQMIVGEEKEYLLTGELLIKNPHEKIIPECEVILPLMHSHPPYQKVEIKSIEPSPDSAALDGYKNILLHFTLKSISPRSGATIRIKARIISCRVLYQVDPEAFDKIAPRALSKYVRETEDFPTQNGLVGKTLSEVIREEKNPYFKTLSLFDFVRSFKFNLSLAPKPVPEALSKRIVQCSDATSCLITLLRASGIPARYVGGVSLVEGRKKVTSTHSWAEVYAPVQGWVPLDPTLSRFNEGSRLLRFFEKEPGQVIFSIQKIAPLEVRSKEGLITARDVSFVFSYEEKKTENLERISKYYEKLIPKINETPPGRSAEVYDRLPPEVSKDFAKAQTLMNSGKFGDADALLKIITAAAPGYIPAQKKRIEACEAGRTISALKAEYREKEESNPPLYHYLLGIIALNGREYSNAFALLSKAKEEGLDSCHLYNTLGYFYIYTKQYGKSIETYRSSMERNPADTRALMNLMNFFYLYKGWEMVGSLSKYGIGSFSGTPFEAYFSANYALSLTEREKYAEAEQFLNSALKRAPGDGWLNCLLGLIYFKKGEYGKAEQALARGLKLGTTDREIFERILKETKEKRRKG